MTTDLDHLKSLITLMNEGGLTEMEIQTGESLIRLSRAAPPAAAMPVYAPAPAAAAQPAAPAAAALPAGDAVTAPMVGTAYLASEPGAAPFIQVGATVAKDQTLLIIEAMKVMNPIRAPRAGTVKAVLVSDAEAVEYGQALVVIG